jgi:enolase
MTDCIKKIHARQILDSRGNPTLEVDILTHGEVLARAAVPSGASRGRHEALELRDTRKKAYFGKGVQGAIDHIQQTLAPALINQSVFEQRALDKLMIELDGTKNKHKLGANTLLGISMAIAKAAAQTLGRPLFQYIGGMNAHLMPMPLLNLYNGGAHASHSVDIQEFMVIPFKAATFSEALRMGAEVFYHLRGILEKRGLSTGLGDEGGYSASLPSNEAVLELLLHGIEKAGYRPGEDMALAVDAAASSWYDSTTGAYHFKKPQPQVLTSDELVSFWKGLVSQYPIVSIEDGMAEDDWRGWQALTKALGQHIQLVGDDLFVTQAGRLQTGIEQRAANAILIKMNQVGTLTETFDTAQLAQKNGYNMIISHRSGETEDTLIADLAVGLHAGQIKAGSVARAERTAKYNQLLRIEERLGKQARFIAPTFAKANSL